MASDRERMIAGKPYDGISQEMMAIRAVVKQKLYKLNVTHYHTDQFDSVLRELCPNAADSFSVEPPFYCDYGDLIYAGKRVFINYGAVILDGGTVIIGDDTLIGPGVHIYTAQHPLDAAEREQWQDCKGVTIGEKCWIGGHVTICPGVTIGNRSVIGAGSVVTKDIPDDVLAVGNPARVIRKLNDTDSQ